MKPPDVWQLQSSAEGHNSNGSSVGGQQGLALVWCMPTCIAVEVAACVVLVASTLHQCRRCCKRHDAWGIHWHCCHNVESSRPHLVDRLRLANPLRLGERRLLLLCADLGGHSVLGAIRSVSDHGSMVGPMSIKQELNARSDHNDGPAKAEREYVSLMRVTLVNRRRTIPGVCVKPTRGCLMQHSHGSDEVGDVCTQNLIFENPRA